MSVHRRGSLPSCHRSHLDPVPCGDANLVKGRNVTSLASSSQMVASAAAMPSSKKSALMEGCEAETLCGSPLDRRLNFLEFSCRFIQPACHAAAQRIASAAPGDPLLLIRFISTLLSDWVRPPSPSRRACCHLGKAQSHLSHRRAIHVWFRRRPKSADGDRFQERLRAIDLLVIDDIQFLQGKSIQQEFCHTLNALIDSRRRS